MSVFDNCVDYEVMRILKSKDISSIIEKIKEEPEKISENEWTEWANKFALGREGYRAVVIEMLKSENCPKKFKDKISMSTSDKDVMFAALTHENNPITIKFLLTNIGKNYMKNKAIDCSDKGIQMPLSYETIQICGIEHMKDYDYLYLQYCYWSPELQNRIKKDGLTEVAATYILNNPVITYSKKIEIFNEYGYDFAKLDFKQLPSQITNELFNIAMETIFSEENIDKHLKKQARDAIMTMYKENILSSFQLEDFCKRFESTEGFAKNDRRNEKLYNNIIMTSTDPMVYKYRKSCVTYKNPRWDDNTINKVLQLKLKRMVTTSISSHTYKTEQQDIADNLLFGRFLDKETIQLVLRLYKDMHPYDNNLRNRETALVCVSNPRVPIEAKKAIIRHFIDDGTLKTKTELSAFADMCTMLRDSKRDRNESEYDNALVNNFTNEEIDYVMAIATFIKGIDTENLAQQKLYFKKPQIEALNKISETIMKKYPDIEIKNIIECIVKTVESTHNARVLYEEYGALFTDKEKYQLLNNGEKTIDILKVDKYSKKDMMEAYQLMDDSHLEKLKEIITDAVNEQTDIGLKYYLYPKYKKQFDIIEEVLFQRDRELVKTPDLDEEFCK